MTQLETDSYRVEVAIAAEFPDVVATVENKTSEHRSYVTISNQNGQLLCEETTRWPVDVALLVESIRVGLGKGRRTVVWAESS